MKYQKKKESVDIIHVHLFFFKKKKNPKIFSQKQVTQLLKTPENAKNIQQHVDRFVNVFIRDMKAK